MAKYTQSFKQQVVDFHLAHQQNITQTARHFGLDKKNVRLWLAQFHHSGSVGLAVRQTKRHYSLEFKLNRIKSVLNGEFTLFDASIRFGIGYGALSTWLKTFEKDGITGLLPKPKGRSSMKPQYAKMPPPPKTEEDRLRLRILELEAEVAFLKKLDEIVKQDEAKRRKQLKAYGKPIR